MLKNNLLIVCGTTSTGKTSLALHLAKAFNGELVSVDSRQVYSDLDIGTGKDLPKNAKLRTDKISGFLPYYEIDGIKVWGYDLVNPKEEFSVFHYVSATKKILKNIWTREKLPILVGGTGLYIKGVVEGIPTSIVPKNAKLRKQLNAKTAKELYEILSKIDRKKPLSLNESDSKNPRRLLRAIEVAEWTKTKESNLEKTSGVRKDLEVMFIGLKLPKELLEKRIEKRVQKRLDGGFENEVKKLLKRGLTQKNQSMNTLGYTQIEEFLAGKKTKTDAIKDWIIAEKKYAKRQTVWFNKDKKIIWFDVSAKNWQKHVEKLVQEWHNKPSG